MTSNRTITVGTTGTFETWLKTTASNPQYSGIVVTATNGGGDSPFVALRWDGGGRVACEGLWVVTQTGASAPLNDGQWHHVAAVAGGGTCKLYIDGVLNATGTAGGPPPPATSSSGPSARVPTATFPPSSSTTAGCGAWPAAPRRC